MGEQLESSQEKQVANEGNQSMYVAIVNQDGLVSDYTPIPDGKLSQVQETLKLLQEVPSKSRSKKVVSFPPITSHHTTPLPGTDHFLVLTGSFGANVTKQFSLWQEGVGFDLTTPTGTLRVEGNTTRENTSLQHYVTNELGPDGFKELASFLDVYDLLTQGQNQTQNIDVTAKQILQRMGKGKHADDNDEQAHLVNTMIYLARTMIVSISSKKTRITPLLVLESISTDEYGTIHLKYHLGEETFESIYGMEQKPYPLPTPRIVGYHGTKSQPELLLTAFFGNRLAEHESCSLYFVTLCTHSGLLTRERLLPGQKNRMRDAQQIIAGLCHLESDGFIELAPHADFDLVVAVELSLAPPKKKGLLPSTLERIEPHLRAIEGYSKNELNTKRRVALQRLLNVESSQEEIRKENPEFCTRLHVSPGVQFREMQKHLLTRLKERS